MFGDRKMKAALLDRPAHHYEIVETGNRSWRFRQHSKRQVRHVSRSAAQIWKTYSLSNFSRTCAS